MSTIALALALAIVLLTSPVSAQWLRQETPGIPRSPDGQPHLSAPPPRTADGKPDLSGLWTMSFHPAYLLDVAVDLDPADVQPAAAAVAASRISDLAKDDPSIVGCQPLGPRAITGGGQARLAKIIQTPSRVLVLFEDLTYRQIFMDGRQLPANPYPNFMGYSVGRWNGDELVVESTGFSAETWLDYGGHPHTESLHITERYRRTDSGHIRRDITIVDPGVFKKPISVASDLLLAPDTELLEYVCTQTPREAFAIPDTAAEERTNAMPPALMRRFPGVYEIESPGTFGVRTLTVSQSGNQLYIGFDGKGRIPLLALSEWMFTPRLLGMYEFITDGERFAKHILIHSVEGTFRAMRRQEGGGR